MPDTGGTKRKSRAGSREDGDDDDTGKNAEKNELAEMQAWLDTVPLISVAPPKQELFQLEHAMTIGRCLEEFAKRKILSAPLVIEPQLDDILDEAGGGVSLAEEGGAAVPEAAPTLLGWIDTGDILSSFLSHLEDHLAEEASSATATATATMAAAEGGSSGGGGGTAAAGGDGATAKKKKRELPTRMLELMTLLEKLGPGFASRTLITVSGGKDRALVFSATAGSSLLEAMRDLFLPSKADDDGGGGEGDGDGEGGEGEGGSGKPSSSPRVVHRVAVFDGHGAITHVISQLDVLRFLAKHKERWSKSALGDKSIADLGLLSGKAPVLTVDPHTPTLLALREMKAAGVSGAAVVSPATGTAIANLSVSDLRAVDPRHLSVLALPVAELLALLHKTTYVGYSAGGSAAAAHPFFAGGRSGSGGRATPVPSSSGGGGAFAASSPSRGGVGGGDTAATTTTTTTATTADAANPSGGGGEANNQGGGEGNDSEGNNAADDDDDVKFIACTPSTTLLSLIGIFLSNSVHRVYVVDDLSAPRPTAVVTPTDVFRVLAGVF